MAENLKKIEKIINSELASKVQQSVIINEELTVETNVNDLIEVVQFLKSNDKCKFRQLIDIAGVDYPEKDKRFQLVYLFLSHENNIRVKILMKFQPNESINSLTKIFPSPNGREREFFNLYEFKFKIHQVLRKIFLDYDLKGIQLRKDFPLTDFNEFRNSEKKKKLV